MAVAAQTDRTPGTGGMKKYIFGYGLTAGVVIILTIMAGLLIMGHESMFSSMLFGYLVMLVALSFIFVGIKRYRDIERGGVVRFGPALGLGLGIAAVAGLAYVAVWEVYLASTDYQFMHEYTASVLRAREAAGATAAEMATHRAELEALTVSYANPLFRLPMTFLELFPVGLLMSLVSAGLLRNPKVLPARG